MHHYSASQLETFTRCQRKWYFEYVEGFRSPATDAMRFGTELHAQLENYLKTGTPPEDKRAQGALRFLGKPRDTLLAERPLKIPLMGSEFIGYVDVTDIADPTEPHILDFKTTSDLQRYAKTDYQLASNIQLNVYAYDILRIYPRAQTAKVSHLYIQSRGATKERLVSAVVKRADVEERWKGYLRVIDDIEDVRAMDNAADVEPNLNACSDYGGCPHRARCIGIDLGGFTAPAKGDTWWKDTNDVLNPPDSTRRSKDAPPATPETVDPENLPKELRKTLAASQKETPKMPALTMAEKLARMANGPPSPPAAKAEALAAKTVFPATILPGGEPPTPPAVTSDEGMLVVDTLNGFPNGIGKNTPAVALVPPPAEEAPKRGRGRPPGSKNVPKNGVVPGVQPGTIEIAHPPWVAEALAAAPTTAPAPVAAPMVGQLMFLFIDVVPIKGFSTGPAGYVLLGDWLAPILEQIAIDTGAPWDCHDYGKGRGILNSYVRKAVLPPALAIDSRGSEASVLKDLLISKANVVFQGVK